jgi:hypothetical protein
LGGIEKQKTKMKYLIPIITFLLFLVGVLILFTSLYSQGPGFYTSSLTLGTLIGFILIFIKRKIGYAFVFIVTIGWLLRYFEHASFLMFYDIESKGRWLMVGIPLLLSFALFTLSLKGIQTERKSTFKSIWIPLAFIVFSSIGLLSFIRKPHVNEINCWYYLNNESNDIKITFAITPDHKFDAFCSSKKLKKIILQEGMTYESRDGYYCPESKVKVITRFKEIVAVKVMGFRNSEIDKTVGFGKGFEIDPNSITGDKSILNPKFEWGD